MARPFTSSILSAWRKMRSFCSIREERSRATVFAIISYLERLRRSMDDRTHIPFAKLLSCLMEAEPLSDDEQEHQKKCSVCQTAAVTQHGSFLHLKWVYSRALNTGCHR